MNLPGYSPDFNADEAIWGWAREEATGKPVLGKQGQGAGEGRQIPGRAVQPEGRGEAALPDGPAVKGRSTPAKFPARFPASDKYTSHLGFGLVSRKTIPEKHECSSAGALVSGWCLPSARPVS